MNTYSIEYQGKTIVKEVRVDELEKTLSQVKGIVTLTGKDTKGIKVVLNRE